VQKGVEKSSTAPSTVLPTLAMLGAVFLWSSSTPGTKFALREIAVADFVIIRLSLAAAALWLIVLVTRTSARLAHVGWRPLVMGLLEPGLVTLLITLGLTMTSPVSGSVFWGLTPLIMPILGRFVLGERIEFVVLIAAAIAFGSTLLLVWGQSQHGGGTVLGDICVASGVLASAVNALLSRRNAQAGANPLVTSSWQLTSACCAAERCACGRSQHPFDGNSGLPRPCRIGRRIHPVELCHTPSPGRPHEPVGLLDRTVWRHLVGNRPWHEGQHPGHGCPRARDMRSGAPLPGSVDA